MFRIDQALIIKTLIIVVLSMFIANTTLANIKRLAPPLPEQQQLPIQDPSAETLYSISHTVLDANGHWQRSVYISIRVNDKNAARDYGRISVPFNHYYSDLELQFANTISADGSISSLSNEAVQKRVLGGGQDFYSDSSELVFSLPDISVGSILEFQYIRRSKTLAIDTLYSDRNMPFWFQNTSGRDGWRADFVHHFSYTLNLPAERQLITKSFSGYSKRPHITQDKNRKTYSWTMQAIPGRTSESWMPLSHEIIPTLYLSTTNDWQIVNDWAWDKVADKLVNSASIQAVVNELNLPANTSNEEKLKAVYAYMQNNIRYVFAHLGRGGYEPHTPEEILSANYGDCKDQAVLAIALLKALGIEAFPALVETARAGQSQTVGLIFDHMLVYLPPGQGLSTQWLDSTGDRSLFPGTSNYLSGQNALIVKPKQGQLTHIPQLTNNLANMQLNYSSEKNASLATVKISAQGFFEQNIRNWWIHSTDKENALRQFLSPLFTAPNVIQARLVNSENLWKPVEIHATFQLDQAEPESPIFGASINQLMRLFSNANQLPLPETKRYRFFDKHPFELHMQANFEATVQQQTPALIQAADNVFSPYHELSYKSRSEKQRYTVDMHYKKYALNLNNQEYQSYYDQIQAISTSETWLVRMVNDENSKRAIALKEKANQFGAQSAEFFIAHARTLIEEGQFGEALEPALKAVDLQQANGEAWYVLGMAQGFNAMIDESSQSFQKAEELGFVP